jgi:hypothetical protein
MLKLMRRLSILITLCSALAVVTSISGVRVEARNNCATCFTACEQEYNACEEWGAGCPYDNDNETFPSQSFWFTFGGINCPSYYAGDCAAAQRHCSIDCADNCL